DLDDRDAKSRPRSVCAKSRASFGKTDSELEDLYGTKDQRTARSHRWFMAARLFRLLGSRRTTPCELCSLYSAQSRKGKIAKQRIHSLRKRVCENDRVK